MPDARNTPQLELWEQSEPHFNEPKPKAETGDPRDKDGHDGLFELSNPVLGSSDPVLAKSFSSTHPLRILVADDIELNRKIIRTILQKLGYDCIEATNGREALDLHTAQTFDYIFMDLDMPEMSGLESAREIRAAEKRKTSPLPIAEIIAVTANVSDKTRGECQAVGMNGYLEKPITASTVKDQLKASWPRIRSRRNRAAGADTIRD